MYRTILTITISIVFTLFSCTTRYIPFPPELANTNFFAILSIAKIPNPVVDLFAMRNSPIAQDGFNLLYRPHIEEVYSKVDLFSIILEEFERKENNFGKRISYNNINNSSDKSTFFFKNPAVSIGDDAKNTDSKFSFISTHKRNNYILEYKVNKWGHLPGAGQNAYLEYQIMLFDIKAKRIIWGVIDRKSDGYGAWISSSDVTPEMIDRKFHQIVRDSFLTIEKYSKR